MKILNINSYYRDSDLYQNLYDSLDNIGVSNNTFYFTNNKEDTSELKEGFYVSRAFNPLDRYIFFLKHTKVFNDFKKLVDVGNYDITHAHSLMSNGYISNRIYREYGIPYIVVVRSTDLFVFTKYRPFLNPLAGRILREAREVIFLSESYYEQAMIKYKPYIRPEELRKKSYIIPNGIDPIFFENIGQAKAMGEVINFIFIGKVDDPNKNVRKIIEVCDRFKGRGERVKLSLIGRLEDEDIKNTINSRSYISYLGIQDKEGVIKHLREADIFIMPSHVETFGLVYAEAMSQGLPVIYTRGQGFDGQFPEGHVGYGVDENNSVEIVNKIDMIIDDYEAMSQRAIESSKKFDWEKIGLQYKEVYKKAMEEKIL